MPGNPFDNIAILSDIYDEDEGVQQLVDSGQLTTASNINRPEPTARVKEINLFNEFNIRNPKADGGRIGYYKAGRVGKGHTPKPGQTHFVKFPTQTAVGEINPKYKGTQYGTKEEINSLIKERDLAAKETYKKGTKKSGAQTAEKRNIKFKKLVDDIVESGDLTALKANIRQRGGKIPLQYINDLWSPAMKAGKGSPEMKKLSKILNRSADELLQLESGRLEKIRDVRKVVDTEKALAATDKTKLKIYNYIKDNDVINLKDISKNLKISQTKVNDYINSIYKDIYKNTSLLGKESDIGFVRYLPAKQTPLRFLLTKLNKIEGIEKIERRTITDLLDKTIGFKAAKKYRNPDLYKAVKSNIDQYYKLKDLLPEQVRIQLDHPLPMSVINQLGDEVRLQKINVSPITQELNLGLKSQFDKAYSRAIKSNDIKLQNNILRVAKQIELPITRAGKQIKDPMKFAIVQGDFKDQIVNSLLQQNRIADNIEKLDPKLLEKAGMSKYKLNVPRIEENIINRIKAIGCPGSAKGGRVQFDIGGSPQCLTRGLDKIRSGTNLSPGDNANIQKLTELGQTTKGARALGSAARLVAGLGVGSELAFGGFFALTDYASGANKQELISNLTYGLAGQDIEEQLKSQDPMYGKAQKLADVYGGFLSSLTKEGVPKPRTRGGKLTTATDVEKAMQPFMQETVPPSLGFKDFDLDMFERQKQADIDAQQKFLQEKEQRALERGFYDPNYNVFTDEVMAADGGLIGDKSGRPPESGPMSQGLPGILKRAMKIKE